MTTDTSARPARESERFIFLLRALTKQLPQAEHLAREASADLSALRQDRRYDFDRAGLDEERARLQAIIDDPARIRARLATLPDEITTAKNRERVTPGGT